LARAGTSQLMLARRRSPTRAVRRPRAGGSLGTWPLAETTKPRASPVLNAGGFGRYVRQLRRARGLTQEVLAERSDLSADTIRRLEHGGFSPSLDTLLKLCIGLDLLLSTLFSAFELCENDVTREVIDLLGTRSPRELTLAMDLLRALCASLDGLPDDDEPIADVEPIVVVEADHKPADAP